MTIADVHFAIGQTHDICQDYGLAEDPAQSGLAEHLAQAIVCDGCSSSPNTDWGARFIARAAATAFRPFDPANVVQRADIYRNTLQLAPQSLDATLLMIRETPDHDAEVIAHGDGVIVARRRDGTYQHWSITFSHNAPSYLSYLLDKNRLETYLAAGGQRLINGGDVTPADPREAVRQVFPRAEYDVVLVMTDGATSFQKRDGTRFVPVPLEDVLHQIMDFKTLTHGFIKRRLGRFLGKFCEQNGWAHNDDFAVAGMVLDLPAEGSTPAPQA